MPEYAADDVHMKLLSKISSQAVQLGDLNRALSGSAELIESCQSKIIKLEETALFDSKRRDEREYSNSNLAERTNAQHQQIITQLEANLRSKSKQCAVNERRIVDLRAELQRSRLQLKTSQQVNPKSALRPQRTFVGSTNINQSREISSLKDEIESLKATIRSYQAQVDESKTNERTMVLKVSVLEETLELQMKYAGASGQSALLTKVSDQDRKIKKLMEELDRTRMGIAGTTTALAGRSSSDIHTPKRKGNGISTYDDKCAHNDSVSTCGSSADLDDDKMLLLERNIASLQHELSKAKKEIKRMSAGELSAQIQIIEGERNTLLAYIQVSIIFVL